MKIYIAARFGEKEKVRELQRMLTKKGHQITADWTLHQNIKPYDKNPKLARAYAVEDLDGVKNCDVFIFLLGDSIGSGSSTELGAAILSSLLVGKPKVYVVGKQIDQNFCFFHPSVERCKKIEEVLNDLV